MTLDVQFQTMGLMFLSGAIMGVVFDACRVLTGQLRMPRWIVALLDLVYWSAATLFVFRVLEYSSEGELRFFVFIGLAAGVIFHYLFLSRAAILSVLWFLKTLKRVITFIRRLFVLFIWNPVLWLVRVIKILLGFLAAFAIFLGKVVLQLIYPIHAFLRFLLRPVTRRLAWPRWTRVLVSWLGRMIRRIFH